MIALKNIRSIAQRNSGTESNAAQRKHHGNRSLAGFVGGLLLGMAVLLPAAYADDTEVFFGRVDPTLQIRPNVLFALDTSGSMGGGSSDPGATQTRIARLKLALVEILQGVNNINVGLMRFNGSYGGGPILYPVKYIDEVICETGDCGSVPQMNRMSSGANDAEQSLVDNSVFVNNGVLSLGDNWGTGDAQLTALRFEGMNIPSGATITSAKLEFTSNRYQASNALFSIGIDDSDDSVELTNNDEDVSDRTLAAIEKPWAPGVWNNGTYDSPDIADVLQQVVDRPGWCGGNAMTIIVSGTGDRRIISARNDPNEAPALRITYDANSIPDTGGCTQKTLVSKIAQKSDDAEQRLSNNSTNISSSDLEMPRDGNRQQLVGIRFQNILIPKNATITEAKLEFTVDERKTGDISMRIWGQASDNADRFRTNWSDISNRPLTGSVDWDDLPVLEVNDTIETPDIKSIVQALVDRGGWESGNSMAFVLGRKSGSGRRTFESYDGEQSSAPTLTIKYSATGGDINMLTVREKLIEEVNNLTVSGYTPILDVMYESTRYFNGEELFFGTSRGKQYNGYDYRNRYHRVSHPESYTGGSVVRSNNCTADNYESNDCRTETVVADSGGSPTYISPMQNSCQTNHLILLSDGAPNRQQSVQSVKNMTGVSNCEDTGNQACITDLARWMAETDHAPGMTGQQFITTYTIGFGIPSQLEFLEDVAEAGGGQYYPAVTSQDLQNAFQSILADVLDVETSFVAPGATVNQFNRLTHRNDIYFSLFKPKENPLWDGNLKKYHLKTFNGDTVKLVDANEQPAVDPSSGFFSSSSQSVWSDVVDGNEVYRGGAAAEIELDHPQMGPRKVFTYTGAAAPTDVELNTSANVLHENNGAITKDLLGISTENDDYRTDLLKWARGVDILDSNNNDDTEDTRKHMGDPMHSRPLIINYNGTGVDSTIFIATNEGYLHAVDHETGAEEFAFVPQELLPNLNDFYTDLSTQKHPYGLDGSIATWIDDTNNNTMVDPGEHAYVFVGMRRGGSNYYALDVTDRNNPVLKWMIKGGPGGTAGFEELGQSWSKPVFTTIKYGTDLNKPVLIFGAGYDVNQDDDPAIATQPRRTDTIGRGIFIVDAETGVKLWSASPTAGSGSGQHQIFTDMQYSIPSDIRVVDIDFDNTADQFYVADMGGQLWRFDFNQHDASGPMVNGGVMAELSDTTSAGARRFYYEPDVSLVSGKGERYLSIAIGTGWRAHPLDEVVQDRFYMIRSSHIYAAPPGSGMQVGEGNNSSWRPIVESDLLDITDIPQPLEADILSHQGWMLRMEDAGEKILGDSITVNNQLIFTSYKPDLDVGICDAAAGGGAVYVVSAFDGSPVMDLDGSESGTNNNNRDDLTKEDRSKDLKHGGIPPEPAALISEDGVPVLLVGPEQPLDDFDFGKLTARTWWQEESFD